MLVLFGLGTNCFVYGQTPSLNFDGTNDYIQTSYTGISGTSARSIEAWIKTTATAISAQKVIVDWGTFVTGGRFTFNILWSNAIRIEVGGSGLSGTVSVNDGFWHHVAVVYDPLASNMYSLYVDGVLDVTGNISTTINTVSGVDMRIGQRIDGVNSFDGDIDEVRVFDYARTATDILAEMNSEYCILPVGLVAYYRLNEGIPLGNNTALTSAIEDVNANSGTLNNFSLSGTSSNWINGPSISIGPTSSTINANSCSNYISPSGNNTWTTSGTYTDIVPNAAGCDSIITINLTVTPLTNSINEAVCDLYISPSGNNTWTMSGVYTDTLQGAGGCDSVITVNLTVAPLTSSINEAVCDSYTSPSGNYTWTINGVYTDTVQAIGGCDSVITVNLTINSFATTIFGNGCESYTSLSGNNTWTASGIYQENYTNIEGCDSIVHYDIVINDQYATVLNIDTCETVYVSPGGNSLIVSGTYYDTLQTAEGCDSTFVINLVLNAIDNSISTDPSGTILTANFSGATTYQWIDCNTNNPIPGETNSTFNAVLNGSFAVEITNDGCSEISPCIFVTSVGINELIKNKIKMYPNPAQDEIVVDLGISYTNLKIEIIDISGRRVFNLETKEQQIMQMKPKLKSGIYLIRLLYDDVQSELKLIIE